MPEAAEPPPLSRIERFQIACVTVAVLLLIAYEVIGLPWILLLGLGVSRAFLPEGSFRATQDHDHDD